MQSRVNDGVAVSVTDVNSNWTDWILGAPACEVKVYALSDSIFNV